MSHWVISPVNRAIWAEPRVRAVVSSTASSQRHAVPLGDPDAVVRMVGDARVVGLGEAGHSGHEFFTLEVRVFTKLVATRGFTTFALEASGSTGLRLDHYVTHGVGDPERIMREEFQGQYVFWNADEYLDLVRWMRHYKDSRPAGTGARGHRPGETVRAGCQLDGHRSHVHLLLW
ncbi:erythromycin esterase family protein [Streptomyces sp. JHA26]|uniref:erythromycin esterase family protein n=1 Tax=Streptomyces sp. JHA26 TaxID=1917143 RepID=UPI0027D86DD3|nr:erythromycin esterase family protein [Streptomyces sp. JHA26]